MSATPQKHARRAIDGLLDEFPSRGNLNTRSLGWSDNSAMRVANIATELRYAIRAAEDSHRRIDEILDRLDQIAELIELEAAS